MVHGVYFLFKDSFSTVYCHVISSGITITKFILFFKILFVVKGTCFEKHNIINKLNHLFMNVPKRRTGVIFLTVCFLSPNSHHDHESRAPKEKFSILFKTS
jgi:hypothetical protein